MTFPPLFYVLVFLAGGATGHATLGAFFAGGAASDGRFWTCALSSSNPFLELSKSTLISTRAFRTSGVAPVCPSPCLGHRGSNSVMECSLGKPVDPRPIHTVAQHALVVRSVFRHTKVTFQFRNCSGRAPALNVSFFLA